MLRKKYQKLMTLELWKIMFQEDGPGRGISECKAHTERWEVLR